MWLNSLTSNPDLIHHSPQLRLFDHQSDWKQLATLHKLCFVTFTPSFRPEVIGLLMLMRTDSQLSVCPVRFWIKFLQHLTNTVPSTLSIQYFRSTYASRHTFIQRCRIPLLHLKSQRAFHQFSAPFKQMVTWLVVWAVISPITLDVWRRVICPITEHLMYRNCFNWTIPSQLYQPMVQLLRVLSSTTQRWLRYRVPPQFQGMPLPVISICGWSSDSLNSSERI